MVFRAHTGHLFLVVDIADRAGLARVSCVVVVLRVWAYCAELAIEEGIIIRAVLAHSIINIVDLLVWTIVAGGI